MLIRNKQITSFFGRYQEEACLATHWVIVNYSNRDFYDNFKNIFCMPTIKLCIFFCGMMHCQTTRSIDFLPFITHSGGRINFFNVSFCVLYVVSPSIRYGCRIFSLYCLSFALWHKIEGCQAFWRLKKWNRRSLQHQWSKCVDWIIKNVEHGILWWWLISAGYLWVFDDICPCNQMEYQCIP